MVDRPLPVSQDDIDQVLSGYGVGQKSGTITPANDDEAAGILKGYGIVLKPGQSRQAPSAAEPSYEETFKGDIAAQKAYDQRRKNDKPGKIPDAPEGAPTKEEFQRGLTRGVAAQTIGGIPIAGPLIDLATAATGPSPAHGENTFAQRFYEQKQADRAFAMAHPLESAGANLAGSTIGYGALAKLPFGATRALLGLEGSLTPTAATRFYGGVAGGAGINALDAALRGENPLQAAEVGAIGGGAAPAINAGARGAANTLANTLVRPPGPLQNVPRAGINLLSGALHGETDASIAAARERMGPNGFLADINHGLGDLAGGIADMPGPEKQMIQEAYRKRLEGQGDRIDNALTKATGISGNFDITQYGKFLTEARRAASDPLYQQFRDTQVHPTPELKALIPRLEKVGAFDEADYLSGATGTPMNKNFFTTGPQKAYPTTETWDLVKRGLDSKIEQAITSGNKTRASALMNLKGELIGEIEKTDAGTVYKQARQEFASRSALIDQLNAGRDTLLGGRSGLSVDELRNELTHLSGPELAARVAGMRKAVAESMGDKTEAAGQVRNKLLAPNNQEKIRLMLSGQPGAADELINTLKSEKYLAERAPSIIPNMNTGASGQTRAERRALFAPQQSQLADWLPALDLTHPLNVIPGPLHPGNVLQDIRGARAGRVAPAIAPLLLTPEGPSMDELVNALKQEGSRQSRVSSAGQKYFANPLSAGVSGPGQFAYRRYIENQPGQ